MDDSIDSNNGVRSSTPPVSWADTNQSNERGADCDVDEGVDEWVVEDSQLTVYDEKTFWFVMVSSLFPNACSLSLFVRQTKVRLSSIV